MGNHHRSEFTDGDMSITAFWRAGPRTAKAWVRIVKLDRDLTSALESLTGEKPNALLSSRKRGRSLLSAVSFDLKEL